MQEGGSLGVPGEGLKVTFGLKRHQVYLVGPAGFAIDKGCGGRADPQDHPAVVAGDQRNGHRLEGFEDVLLARFEIDELRDVDHAY